MSDSQARFHAAMGQFQQEVMRWNRQINLVSRKDTMARTAGLIGQCRDAWVALDEVEGLSSAREHCWGYFDLGSGGGLPGFVWHQLLASRLPRLKTWLVEPREKRAWFLERLNKITPEHPVHVWNARWGETPTVADFPLTRALVSMKALRLPDPVVLAGLNQALGERALPEGGAVVIARFYPPEQKWSEALVAELEIPPEPLVVAGARYVPQRQQVVSPKSTSPAAASLVLSTYKVSS